MLDHPKRPGNIPRSKFLSSSNLHSVHSSITENSTAKQANTNQPKGTNIKSNATSQFYAKAALDLRKASDARPKAFSPIQKQSIGPGALSPKPKQTVKIPTQTIKQTQEKQARTDNIKQVKQTSSMANLNKKQQAIYDKLKRSKAENTVLKSETSKKTTVVNLTTISSIENTEAEKTKRKGKSINHNNFKRPVNNLENESINILENAHKQKKILVKKEENIWSKIVNIFTPFSCGIPRDNKLK